MKLALVMKLYLIIQIKSNQGKPFHCKMNVDYDRHFSLFRRVNWFQSFIVYPV